MRFFAFRNLGFNNHQVSKDLVIFLNYLVFLFYIFYYVVWDARIFRVFF
uniref:Uncharacterized protein n=1 Tax=Rhizophora mucronata TaxID=61149 RepID=A0A2P2IL14_RHIMU